MAATRSHFSQARAKGGGGGWEEMAGLRGTETGLFTGTPLSQGCIASENLEHKMPRKP